MVKAQLHGLLKQLLHKLKNLMDKFEKVIFSHTFHEGNSVVDWIANQGVQRESKLRWHDDLRRSVDLKALTNNDKTHTKEGKIS